MSMRRSRNPLRERNYCSEAEYIDEVYICKVTGKECELGFFPNSHECYTYVKTSMKKTD